MLLLFVMKEIDLLHIHVGKFHNMTLKFGSIESVYTQLQ